MRSRARRAACLWLGLIALSTPLRAQTDLYPFPKIEEEKIKLKEVKPASPFVQELVKRTGADERVLSEASDKGMARGDLIRLVLISQKGKKPLPDLIKEREKNTSLAKIAESAGQDNKVIRKEAKVLLDAITKELQAQEKKAAEVKRSTPTAGVAETLSKDTTGPATPAPAKP